MTERFGKYELLRRIGAGGMAEVFVAKTHGAEGFVKHLVIKRILPAFNEDPDFVRMFINEAHLAARLQHANIVQIYDFDHVDETYYIAMEWVDGTDLRRIHNLSRRRQIPLPSNVAVHAGVETLKGLHYAHTKSDRGKPLQLVHRDISPHNLLVSFSGEVKITDFGIAKVAALAGATRSGAVKGKLTYMSPEQINGELVDARTDIFALGIVLWELLAERRLYAGAGSEGELMAAVRRADIAPLRSVNERIDEGLARVVERMLAPDPDNRYQTAAEALGDLSSFASISDSLELSDYMTRLMPREAEREQGQTALMSQPVQPRYAEAAPDAPTRTAAEEDAERSASGSGSGSGPGSGSGSSAPGLAAVDSGAPTDSAHTPGERAAETPAQPMGADPTEPPRTRAGSLTAMQPARVARVIAQPTPGEVPATGEGEAGAQQPTSASRVRWLIALVALLVAGGAGWFITGLVVASAPSAQHAPVRVGVLQVQSQPPGAQVYVAGMALPRGRTPLTLRGPSGKSVELVLELAGHVERATGRFGGEVVKRVFERTTADAGVADASVARDARRRDARKRRKDRGTPRRRDAGRRRDAARRRDVRAPVVIKKRGHGVLKVFCTPWANVEVDGKSIGYTPVKHHTLLTGRHVVKLTNPAIDQKRTYRIRIVKGQTKTITARFKSR